MKKVKVLSLAFILLLAWTAGFGAGDARAEVEGFATAKAEKWSSSKTGTAFWHVSWPQGVQASVAPLDGTSLRNCKKADVFLSDLATGRAYLATYDRRKNSVRLSYVNGFMRESGFKRVNLGECAFRFDEDDPAFGPCYSAIFDDSPVNVGYTIDGPDTVSIQIFDVETDRAYIVTFNVRTSMVDGEIILNLHSAG